MELLNTVQCAGELGLKRHAVIHHLRKRHLIGVKVGKQYVVTREALEDFKLNRRGHGRPHRVDRRRKPTVP